MPQEFRINPLRIFDEYKYYQQLDGMYPDGTTNVVLYYTARGGEFPYAQLFGLQYIVKKWLVGKFFTQEDLDEITEERNELGRPFNREIWQYILNKYDGHLPIKICAVKEGVKLPLNNVMFTVESTDNKCFWLPGALEDVLQHAWHPSGVCVKSSLIREIAMEFLLQTSDIPEIAIQWMLNDFGLRSSVNMEAGAAAGAAHLLNFRGSDTGLAEQIHKQFYGVSRSTSLYDSVAATEHSQMTAEGKEGEIRVVGRLLDKFEYIYNKPNGILSLVGDSFDIYNFTENIIGGVYRDRIARILGKIVVRPDSGDPLIVVPRLLQILADKFGFTVNNKGYKVLSPCVGVIWGDGMDLFSIRQLFAKMRECGWATENCVVGMGGGLVQKINRDSQKVAIKCCEQTRNGQTFDIYKEAPGKNSFRGHPALVYHDETGKYDTIRKKDLVFPLVDLLEPVLNNGDLKRDMAFDEIQIYSCIPFVK